MRHSAVRFEWMNGGLRRRPLRLGCWRGWMAGVHLASGGHSFSMRHPPRSFHLEPRRNLGEPPPQATAADRYAPTLCPSLTACACFAQCPVCVQCTTEALRSARWTTPTPRSSARQASMRSQRYWSPSAACQVKHRLIYRSAGLLSGRDGAGDRRRLGTQRQPPLEWAVPPLCALLGA